MTMKVLLINDNSAHPNWGAQATPYSLIRILEQSIRGVEVTPLSWDWLRRSWSELRIPGFPARFVGSQNCGALWPFVCRLSRPVKFYPGVADDFDFFADEWVAGRGGPDGEEFIRLAKTADVVVYSGENSIYRNTVEGCRGLFLLWLAKTRLGKPSCLVNHTVNLNEVKAIMNAMVQLVDPILDLVAVRESRSLNTLHDMGIHSAVLCPDVVFAEEPEEISKSDFESWSAAVGLEEGSYFCLSASGLPMSQPSAECMGAVGGLIEALDGLNLRPVLLARDPHCQFLSEIAERTGSLFFGPDHHFTELWALFRGARFSITGHFHYMIIGASVGCPFVPLSNNNHKVSGLCELLQWHRTEPFDATWLTSCQSEIVSEARWLSTEHDRLAKHLVERSTVLRLRARELGGRIRGIVENREAGSAA